MALPSQKPNEPLGDEILQDWENIGSGGFGDVYKARHKDWGFDVAIKLLHRGVCPSASLWIEAEVMTRASCDCVLRLYGTYKGFPPIEGDPVQRRRGGEPMQEGLVMAFMERGSLQSLFDKLHDPLLWPLVCRLAHQVAVGMNFLHQQDLMHGDLKPCNVLLDDHFNAKLADFGLSRVSTSCMSTSCMPTEEKTGYLQGTYKYMPPEAFDSSYHPVRAFDIYSYGILLWSILSGKEPYPCNNPELVIESVRGGQRPPTPKKIDKEGWNELVNLMEQCWDNDPSKRPKFKDSLETTEAVFSQNRDGIPDAVCQVEKAFRGATTSNQLSTRGKKKPFIERTESNDEVDFKIRDPIKVSTREMSCPDKVKFVDEYRPNLIRNVTKVMEITDLLGEMVHDEARASMAAAETSYIRMRKLYSSLHSGGDKVKAAFYDALAQLHPELV
uniref:Protein kinase domain-containing protein n=1 Tax=Gasterosteus aculeatus aculeatus TaxID=481459 RepID=A0AAQ4P8S1_GASAC|nr:receptor-interacting serine/threonine-protein kinase 3-like isoform X2 [Gasterosteus aculeatus aculeatus]